MRRWIGFIFLVASATLPLWLAYALSRTFVADLGPTGLILTQSMIVGLLGYSAALLCAVGAVLGGSVVARFVLTGIIAVGALVAIGGLLLLLAVGLLLKAGAAIVVALQIGGGFLLLRSTHSRRSPR